MKQFVKKGHGRIYVREPADIAKVEQVLKDVNFFEHDGYYPEGLVQIFPEDGKVCLQYTHKYEACIDAITLECWKRGIVVWCISQLYDMFDPEPNEPEVILEPIDIKVTVSDPSRNG